MSETFEWNEQTIGCIRSTADWSKFVPAEDMNEEPREFDRGFNA